MATTAAVSGGQSTAAAAEIRRRAPQARPRLALLLGSGLGGIAREIAADAVIPYGEIPGFPECTVAGHEGRLILGRLGGAPVACLQGRAHVYEGHDAGAIATPIRTLRALGAEMLVMASAVGSLRAELAPGALVLVEDHINLSGRNPLIGPNDDSIGPRFPDMTGAYDATLRDALANAAVHEGVTVHAGVYAYMSGPSFETPAEVRALARLGADVVGMSTVPECVIARHAGLAVGVVAVVTNLAAGLGEGPITFEEAAAVGAAASNDLGRLLKRFAVGLAG